MKQKVLVKNKKAKISLFIFINLLVLCLSYLSYSVFYYRTIVKKEYHFDPFVQSTPPLLDRGSILKDDSVFRIVCLGGSTTACDELIEEEKWPNVLQTALQEKYPERKVEVINAGLGWYTTKHSLINYVTYYRDWQPDLVIVMHAINDLYRSFAPKDLAIGGYNDRWAHFYGPIIDAAKGKATFEENLADGLNRAIKNVQALEWLNGHNLFRAKEEIFNAVDYPVENYISLDMFGRHLETLVHCVNPDEAKMLLIKQPFLYKDEMKPEEHAVVGFNTAFCQTREVSGDLIYVSYPSVVSLMWAMEAFNDTTEKVGDQAEVLVIDAAQKMPKDLGHFLDDVHYTVKGAQFLAHIVAEEIIGAKLLE
jgi:lysophospholipase L1-like esterase